MTKLDVLIATEAKIVDTKQADAATLRQLNRSTGKDRG